MRKIDYSDAVRLVEREGAKVWHVHAPEGICYVICKYMPVINDAFLVARIPDRFAKNPRIYSTADYYRGWFWWSA